MACKISNEMLDRAAEQVGRARVVLRLFERRFLKLREQWDAEEEQRADEQRDAALWGEEDTRP